MFAVNARAPFFLMCRARSPICGGGAPGGIVNIPSINIHCGAPRTGDLFSEQGRAGDADQETAANAYRFDRIRVNGINVGWTDTPGERQMQGVTLGLGEGWLDKAAAQQPFGRLLQPEEIARLALFLLSDAAGPMTGALIDQEQWVAGSRS